MTTTLLAFAKNRYILPFFHANISPLFFSIFEVAIVADKPNFSDLMKMAAGMQQNMKKMQQNLADKTITGEAGADDIKVSVTLNGAQTEVKTSISPAAFEQGINVVEELVASATLDAINKARNLTKNSMMDVYEKNPFNMDDLVKDQ